MTRKPPALRRTLTHLILLGVGALLAVPFIYMISISLASDRTTAQFAFSLFPREFVWRNYLTIFGDPRIPRFFLNSVIIAGFSIFGQVFVSSFVAYGFARLRAPGKNLLFIVLLSTLMIPWEITLIPQFFLFTQLGWVNTLLPLIVPNFFGGAFNIFLLRQFITRIPAELDDAAKIDGLGYFGIYRVIILPLIRPALVAIGILTFNFSWGNFLGPLIYINDVEKMPLALGLQVLTAKTAATMLPPWNIVMVASMLLTVPMIIVFFIWQRHVFELNLSAGTGGVR